MAAVDDLIAQVPDARLRDRLTQEWAEASQGRKFGLVFEQHLPELLVMPRAKPRAGSRVCVLGDEAKTVWRVRRVAEGMAWLRRGGDGGGESQELTVAADQLQVVRQFGDPIFPALTPVDRVQNGGPDAPWHTLIEADNYHALQLLDYLYAGKVDCIYIDPPYNTGARDWKYNNDYVDGNDTWRHSKWLAFMERRLKLAKRLLKPNDGVLVVTIDEHEVHHLGLLLEKVCPEYARQTVTIVINQKGVAQGRFARAEEYALYGFQPGAGVVPWHDDLLSPERSGKRFTTPRWEWLLRGGTNSRRIDREQLFFQIHVDPKSHKITAIDDPLPPDQQPDLSNTSNKKTAWPLRTDGSLGNWRVSPPTLRKLVAKGYVKLGGFDEARGTWTVLYLGQKAQRQIESGVIEIVEHDPVTGVVDVRYTEQEKRFPKTVWHRPLHDSGIYGSALLKSILGDGAAFSFPKSLYSTRDAIAAIIRDRPDALVVDFFAGSGTTLNALNLMNAVDGGRRRCILVTNNEVSADEAAALGERRLKPGDEAWEAHGICQSVTWPRSKYTILGKRDDGTTLDGEYVTGEMREIEKPRKFTHAGFVDAADLNTVPKRKQLVALIDGLPQTLVTADTPFIVSDAHDASVLFDPAAKDGWLEALEGQDHIGRFFIVAPRKADFDAIKAEVQELLGPLTISEEEKRPMAEGFAANLEYFRLDFLEPARVQLRRAFREILPLLWLKAGAVGPRPTLARDADETDLLLPEGSNFAVLLHESKVRKALTKLAKAPRLDVMYLVTDDEEAFRAMSDAVRDVRGEAGELLETVQLYRSYLDNFTINRAGTAEGTRA